MCGYLRLVLGKVRLRRSIVMQKNRPRRRRCVFRPYLLDGICHYIFTVRGSASLKLRVDSAGRTIGVGRSRGSRASTHCCTNQGSFSATGKTSDEGPTSGAAANHGGSTLPFALEVAADRTSFHVVTVSVHRDGLEDKPEYGGTLKACLAVRLQGLCLMPRLLRAGLPCRLLPPALQWWR